MGELAPSSVRHEVLLSTGTLEEGIEGKELWGWLIEGKVV
jgi:hypothetical protein